jgi:hypothetical protein
MSFGQQRGSDQGKQIVRETDEAKHAITGCITELTLVYFSKNRIEVGRSKISAKEHSAVQARPSDMLVLSDGRGSAAH